jgi:hypothetical protein
LHTTCQEFVPVMITTNLMLSVANKRFHAVSFW